MKKVAFLASTLLLPVFASAQTLGKLNANNGLEGVVSFIKNLINVALPLLIAAAVVYLVFNIIKYVVVAGEEAKKGAKDHIVWGVIGLFAIVSIWGLVNLLSSSFTGKNSIDQSQINNLTNGLTN
jgi:hypothetical protein